MADIINNFSIISLEEATFIGGTYKELTFEVLDESGTPVDISTYSTYWALSPYGKPDSVSLLKPGVYRTDCTSKNRFTIYLYSYDTSGLSGKFIQQPVLILREGYEFRLGQGIINIVSSIGGTTISDVTTVSSMISEISGSFANMNIAREKLTANRIYYVRTDGSDSNNGLANTSGGAFLTIQKAVDATLLLDTNDYTVTIQLADGTYTGGAYFDHMWMGGGNVTIQGNSVNPQNVIVSTTSSDAIYANTTGGMLTIKDMELRTTTSGNCIYGYTQKALIQFTNIRFGTCAGYHIMSNYGAMIQSNGNYAITGGATSHLYAYGNGNLHVSGRTITVSAGLTMSSSFALASRGGQITAYSDTFTDYTMTCVRYTASQNAVIYTGGGGATYFPGNSAGGTDTGGQYV